jgi:Icc-related predicted phosphoesterase
MFLGWGTDGFTKRNEDFRETARKWRQNLHGEKTVVVTHAPPANTKLDALENNMHVGNIDIRKEIERIQPILSISGHIHESEGKQDRIGKTLCVNPGWNGMVLDV